MLVRQGFNILVLCWFDCKGMYVVKGGVFSDLSSIIHALKNQ